MERGAGAVIADIAGDAARLLKALANDKRLLILCMLVEREHSVGELNARVDLSQPFVDAMLPLGFRPAAGN